MTKNTTSSELIAGLYLQAWHTHDVEKVLGFHSADSVYRSVATGREAHGHNAIRDAITQVFAVWPDLRFEPIQVHATEGLVVAESIMHATQALPLTLRGIDIQPTGRAVACAVADILVLRNGLITKKHAYVDALHYADQMSAFVTTKDP